MFEFGRTSINRTCSSSVRIRQNPKSSGSIDHYLLIFKHCVDREEVEYYKSAEIEVDSSENFLIALGQKEKEASVDHDGLAPHPVGFFFSFPMMMIAIDILRGTLHLV